METDLASAAYQELGYTEERPLKESKVVARIPLCPSPNYSHESEELTSKRMARALEAIFSVFPDAKFQQGSSQIIVETPKNKFEFFPSSDTFIHSGFKFDSGIVDFCAKLMQIKLSAERLTN